jgi:hypothetical protein
MKGSNCSHKIRYKGYFELIYRCLSDDMYTKLTSVLRPGLARRVNPGPGRPGPVAGPGLSKKQVGNWPGQTRSTRRVDPGPGWDPGLFFIYILMPKTTLFWPFTIKRPKRQEQRDESRALQSREVRRRPN